MCAAKTRRKRPPIGQVLQGKGAKVSTVAESLTIKIGVDPDEKKRKKEPNQMGQPNNKIKTTKYTLLTFLPQNLFEQFRRIANFYFLVMGIIALLIDSPVSPLTSIAPLIFVVVVTATKQAYEDFLRYRTDRIVNYSLVTVVRGGLEMDIKCQNIRPGDLVRVPRDCDVPCDIVLLKSSDPSRKCHITTANLDGETNLKTLSVPKGLPDVEISQMHKLGVIECELPQTDLYSFTGRIELNAQSNGRAMLESVEELDGNVLPLMTENLLLRGCKVRNTEWIIGCAVYTGQYTKMALNSKITSLKMSSSEKWINRYLIFFLILLIVMVTVSYFLKRYYDIFNTKYTAYLGPLEKDNKPNPVGRFLQDYFSFLVLYNYLIPISLYVTIELQKFIGSLFMEWDLDLFDGETDQPFIVNTSDLNEELGQINILFSDKTGTLTKNMMVFQQCSINGKRYKKSGRGLQEVGRKYSLKLRETSKHAYEFFEALAVCHTVQVTSYLEDDDDDQEIPINFDQIDEEGENSDSNADISPEMTAVKYTFDTVTAGPTETNTLPLPSPQPHEPPRPFSENLLARLQHRAGKVRPMSMSMMEGQDPESNMAAGSANEVDGSSRSIYNRTVSHVEPRQRDRLGHRRTQSDMPSNRNTIHPDVVLRQNSNLPRRTSTRSMSREYYAAESYTEAALLERKESILRSKGSVNLLDRLEYQASSPDEKALVEACGQLGMIFLGDDNDILNVRVTRDASKKNPNEPGNKEYRTAYYKRLQVLEFTSDRKRMSVIVQDKDRQLWLFTKGAESHVLPLCTSTSGSFVEKTQGHIDDFAREGLRTLAVARKRLTRDQFMEFNRDLRNANNSLTDRVKMVEECQRNIETGLELLGATAVEDALQDNVRDTLVALRQADIKIWVLTGDKIETALNIAYSCGHIPEDAIKYFITECRDKAQITAHFTAFGDEMKGKPLAQFALLIDGVSLAVALDHTPTLFRDLAIQCHAVLCCRLSPLQKSEVVKLMKTEKRNPICASIGDGANDVSMINEAHVGLGIVGLEGRQAARCADYAFANFSMVKKLLLVHGHYFSQRLAILTLYFFYKNLVFMGIQFFFQLNSQFSTQSIYDSLFLTLYNVIYTSVPILILALSEKIYTEKTLIDKPELYTEVTRNKKFHWQYFCGWMVLGLYHAGLIYLFAYFLWMGNPTIRKEPYTTDLWSFGTAMMHNVVVIVNLKLWLEAMYQTYIFIATIWGSILAFMVTTYVYSFLHINYDGDMLRVYGHLLLSSTFWLLCLIIIIGALLPDYTIKAFKAFSIGLDTIFPGTKAKLLRRRKWRNQERVVSTYL